jgi:hypothetical protein
MADPRTSLPESSRLAALWTGVLLAPTAFLANLELGYLAVRPACLSGSSLVLHLVHAACLLAAAGGGWVAWRNWRNAGGAWSGEGGSPESRSRFLAVLGIATSALFGLTIVAQWLPSLSLHPCQ